MPGLVMESGSFDALVERMHFAIPELLALNSVKAPRCHLSFLAECHESVMLNG